MTASALLGAVAVSAGAVGGILLLVRWLDPATAAAMPLSPMRLLLGAAMSLVLARRFDRGRTPPADLVNGAPLVPLVVLLVLVAALLHAFGTDSVGGADSAGYLGQAHRWRTGTLQQPLPLPDLPVDDPAALQSPLGFRPTASRDATVPIYPPGLPLVQAAAVIAGGHTAAVRLVPGLFALVVLVALYLLGRSWLSPSAALLAVAVVATSPPFLFQALQPMSDVPTLAAWLVAMAAAARGGRIALTVAGLSAALAIALRPNLAPLLVPVAVMGLRDASSWAGVARRAAPLVAPGALVAIAYLAWQARLYGSPWQSGYGTADELFALRYIPVNIQRQIAWMLQSHGVLPAAYWAVGAAALFSRLVARPLMAAALIVWLIYACYQPFDNWTYLRFLLLPLALASLAASASLAHALRAVRPQVRPLLTTAVLVVVVSMQLVSARALGVFDLHRHESRFALAAGVVRNQAPDGAVVLAAQHSGALAVYTRHPILRLDLLRPDEAPAVLAWLRTHGRPTFVVLDDDERDAVMSRLSGVEALRLDWPARAHVGRPVRTRVWALDDREAYQRGRPVQTMPVWPPRR